MRITIIAATGGVGRQLVSQALAAGHDVTAVARDTAMLPSDVLAAGTARVVTVDLARPDPQALESAVAGADAVLSALGPHNNSDAWIAGPTRPATAPRTGLSCSRSAPGSPGPCSARSTTTWPGRHPARVRPGLDHPPAAAAH